LKNTNRAFLKTALPIIGIGFLLVFINIFAACREITNEFPREQPPSLYIRTSPSRLDFGPHEETRIVTIRTNARGINIDAPDWLIVENTAEGISVTVLAYSGESQTGNITLTSIPLGYSIDLPVARFGADDVVFGGGNDIRIPVSSASASESQSGQGIENSFDGNMNTLFHSRWNNATQFPVRLSYYFNNAGVMDYFLYHTRVTGTNGNFQEVEIWVADNGSSILRKYGEFNFNGLSARVRFEPALINPTIVEFRVLSGMGGFASAAEMEFFQRSPENFDYLTIFADRSISSLKDDITREMIDKIPDMFFRDLALQIYLGIYDPTGFRVQEYRAWVHPDGQAAANRTAPYSLRDNPTGIFVRQGEELIVFAEGLQGPVSILSQDLTVGGWGTHRSYPLSMGMNRFSAAADGLIYVQYYSALGENAPRLTLHFATGAVNGFFDSQRHQREEWRRLLDAAIAPDFDLVGRFAHLTFPTESFRRFTPDGLALIDTWDDIVRLQHEFMGLYKHDRVFKNRLYAHVDYNPTSSWMYATNYRTGYSLASVNRENDSILDVNRLRTTAVWGPAHEVGHKNQVRPGVRWNGMTEVTVNIYSLHVQTSFGNRSRLHSDNVYNRAFNVLLGSGRPHRVTGDGVDVWVQLVPFWQLKLYLVDVLDQTDFYKDLFYYYMTSNFVPHGQTDGGWQLHFVRTASKIAELNLIHFFEQWGFLTPVDIGEGSGRFLITQEEIDVVKSEIAAMGFPSPPRDFTEITDESVHLFR